MTEISIRFTIVTRGSLDPGMHFGLEVKRLRSGWHENVIPLKCEIKYVKSDQVNLNLNQICLNYLQNAEQILLGYMANFFKQSSSYCSWNKEMLCQRCFIFHSHIRPLWFFLCLRWARTLDLGSALPSLRIGLLLISEKKQFFSGDKKNITKKTKFISGEKKTFFRLSFFCLFFSSPSITFFQIDYFFFYFVALINFSRNLSNVFFILSLTLPKIGSMVFFLKSFFYRPLSLDFGFFLI